MTKKYIYGPGIDNPIVMINVSGTTETWYYYYADALGSIRFITDDEGTIQESYVYDPFGKLRVMISAGTDGNWLTEDVTLFALSSPLGNPYMFTARRWDYYASLYYYRFRDYHPDLGRFCQPDPIGYWDSMNLYQYCLNNPVNWKDLWGKGILKDIWEAIKEALGYGVPDGGSLGAGKGVLGAMGLTDKEARRRARDNYNNEADRYIEMWRDTPYTWYPRNKKHIYVEPIDIDEDGTWNLDTNMNFEIDLEDRNMGCPEKGGGG